MQANIPSEEECLSVAQQYKASRGSVESVEFFLLSSSPDQGLDAGMNVIKGYISVKSKLVVHMCKQNKHLSNV